MPKVWLMLDSSAVGDIGTPLLRNRTSHAAWKGLVMDNKCLLCGDKMIE